MLSLLYMFESSFHNGLPLHGGNDFHETGDIQSSAVASMSHRFHYNFTLNRFGIGFVIGFTIGFVELQISVE